MKKLSGKQVRVDMDGSVGLGRIDGNKLYGPGKGVIVPVELANAIGKEGTPVEPPEDGGLAIGGNPAAPTGGAGTVTTSVKLEKHTISVTAGKATAGFPKVEGDINDKTVDDLEDEIAARGITLPENKGSGASGNYVKQDLVTVLVATHR